MAITDAVLNELIKDYQKPEDLLGKNGLFKQLQKRLLEKAMDAECRGRGKTRQRRFKTRQRRRSKTGFLQDRARSDWC